MATSVSSSSFAPLIPAVLGRTVVDHVDAKSILTPTSGFMSRYKFTLNPYVGCSFGCEYCYARFFAPPKRYRETWGRWVTVKRNAVALMSDACRSGVLKSGDKVFMSSVTDPYQPIEKQSRLTRAVLETILNVGVQPRLTIQTRSQLVTRDVDLFRRFQRLRVNVTVTTDSDKVHSRYEPHCPPIAARFKALEALSAAGVRIGVSISPMLPIDDVESFGKRLADLNAEEYVTQYLRPGRSRFAAGTNIEAVQKAREDGWTVAEYRRARAVLSRVLGSQRTLLEGEEGYAPA